MEASSTESKPLYNSRLIDTFIKFIKHKYSYINIPELLNYAGMELYQVEDEEYWFTQKQVNLFYARLEKLSGRKNIAREAGRYAASPETLGIMRQYVLGLIGPTNAYEIIGKFATKFTRSSFYNSRRISSNKVEIIVAPNPGVKEEAFQCENRFGYLEAISTIFNFKLPKIEHPECIFKGGKTCRYIVSWQKSRSVLWKKIRNYAILSLPAVWAGSFTIDARLTLTTVMPLAGIAVVFLVWFAGREEARELNAALLNLRAPSDKLLDEISLNYNNVLMINEIGHAISKESDINGILSKVTDILKQRLDYDRGLILLANTDRTRLKFLAGFGYTDEQRRFLKKIDFHLDKSESKGAFVVSFREQRPFLINDMDEIKETLSFRSLQFAKKMGSKSFMCCPIIHEDEALGILAVDNIETKRPLIQRDINLLMGIAPQIGVSVHNARLVEAKLQQFKSILQVLVASTDARDPITAGHSIKVTDYAVGVCRELGMSKDYTEMIRGAALLHDYGKIGVDDSILKKPGSLTKEEYKAIQTHAAKTRDILAQVNFGGIYCSVPEVAGAHHEKIDGSGYPRGLKGEEIPFGAKILAVADVFEAVTSKRHYHEPMHPDVAFEILQKGIGKHFDRDCVDALKNYYYMEEYGKNGAALVAYN